ncbi:MAG TPA: helix-turn-helix domain-containing protein [Caulobacteraceae bacterium]
MLIQKLRLQHGWSQEELAVLSGLSARTIQRLERGHPASVESLKALASVFEIEFSRLKETDMTSGQQTPDYRADEALALARVRKIKGFYVDLATYVLVIGGLAIINISTSPGYWWVVWPAAGWGIGVVAHAMQVFDRFPFLNGEWERREVEKILGRKL